MSFIPSPVKSSIIGNAKFLEAFATHLSQFSVPQSSFTSRIISSFAFSIKLVKLEEITLLLIDKTFE